MAMDKQTDPKPLLTPRDAAKLLNVPTHRIHHLIYSKKLPALKVGKLWRIRRSEVTKWAQPNREA
jgi:excisionase family DNA binding protein